MGRRLLLLLSAGVLLAGCGDDAGPGAPDPSGAATSVRVTSPVITEGKPIPAAYTCQGAGTSPELHWSGVPAEAKSLALVVDDPDAPNGTYTHWLVVDIPVSTQGATAGRPPVGGHELKGSGGRGWKPPCPPSGTHHYRFSVYALRAPLELPGSASIDEAVDAIASATVAWGRLTGKVTASGGDSGGGY